MADIHQYEPLWGSWHVDTLLGEGSFGKVYRVHREEFGKMYYSAVKIITIPQNEGDLRQMKSEGMDDASARSYLYQFVADIIQEIDLLSEFRGNSNIVSFEDHKVIERPDEIGWDILIRMELLTSLTDYVIEHPPSPDEVVKLGIHICKALELCAAHNTIHRDIKPDNIFVSKFGEYKLGDFGIARQIERTMSGLSKKGTYTYMAPEVFKGEEYGASVDIYSLGIVMYRLLNHNRIPFLPDFPAPITPSDRDESLARRMRGEPLPPLKNIPLELNDIILRACVYDKQNRIGKPKELCESLEAIAANMKNMSLVDIGSITDRTIGADTVLMPLASPYEKAGGVESATPVPKFNELGRCAKCGQETDLHGMFCWHCGVKLDVLKTLDGADETVLNPVQKVPSSAKKLRLIQIGRAHV